MIRMVLFLIVILGIVVCLILITANILVGIIIMKKWKGLDLKFDDEVDEDEKRKHKEVMCYREEDKL